MKLKNCLFCFSLCLLTTLYLVMEIYIIKNQVSISDIILRYISSVIIGLAFEKYFFVLGCFLYKLKRMAKQKIHPGGIIQYLYFLFVFGVLGLVVPMGTFIVLCAKFMFGFSITMRGVVIAYRTFLIIGFFFGSIAYIVNRVMQKVKS